MKAKKNALLFKISNSDFNGHGGQKRAFQIENLVSEKYETTNVYFKHDNPVFFTRIFKIKSYIKFFKRKWHKKILTDRRNISRFNTEVCRINLLDELIQKYKTEVQNADLIIWEATFPYYLYFPIVIKNYTNATIVACPHNLESLVKGQHLNWYNTKKTLQLAQEVQALKMCNHVFVISEEEQWLLNLLELPAKYLPYFPPKVVEEDLLAIRKHREESEIIGDTFLILGSAINPPTRESMKEILDWMIKGLPNCKKNIVVAGYGTDLFKGQYDESQFINIEGSISKSRLEILLKECKAVIVPQGYSSGSATRIIEFLIAGIPVMCDTGTSRSYRRMNGVNVYLNFDDLKAMLFASLTMPNLPVKPQSMFDDFSNTICADL